MRNGRPGLFSHVIRMVVVLCLVGGVGWYGMKHDVLGKVLDGNDNNQGNSKLDNAADKLNDKLDSALNITTAQSNIPQWNKEFADPDKGDRPYKKYDDKALEIIGGNVGKYTNTPGYKRSKFFIYESHGWNKVSRQESQNAGWKNFPNKKCSTRDATLIEQGKNVSYTPACKITKGTFVDQYGKKDSHGKITYKESKNKKDFDIDHVVALSLAWRSGYGTAPEQLRNMVANDRANLVVSDPSENRSKGDQSIDQWFPPQQSRGYCDYVDRYAYIKAKYNMIVTDKEYQALKDKVNICNAQK